MKKVTNLMVGDLAPVFNLSGPIPYSSVEGGWDPRELLGQSLVLFFYPPDGGGDLIREFKGLYDRFLGLSTNVIGVSNVGLEVLAGLTEAEEIPFLLLSDRCDEIRIAYGVDSLVAFILAPNRQIIKVYDLVDPMVILADLQELLVRKVRLDYAPVLVIPHVFSGEFCRELMEIWENQGHVYSPSGRQDGGGTSDGVNYRFMKRGEHFVGSSATLDYIKRLIFSRVCPYMKQVFNFDVSRFEGFSIVCYDAAEGGYLKVHRDNEVSRDAHRRFALSINLNGGDYEGGELVFPEYDYAAFSVGTGSAIAFSTSCLHEVREVSSGRRFTLFGWVHGENEVGICQANERSEGELLWSRVDLIPIFRMFNITLSPGLMDLVEGLDDDTLQAALKYVEIKQKLDKIDCATGVFIQALGVIDNPVEFSDLFNLAYESDMMVDSRIVDGRIEIAAQDGEWMSWDEFVFYFQELYVNLEGLTKGV